MPYQRGKVRIAVGTSSASSRERLKRSKAAPTRVGSPLLQALAARVWAETTDGAGVVLVDGKPVEVKGGS